MSTQNVGAAASPFVIDIRNASIKVLPSIINVVVIIAVLSVGNSSVNGCSRTFASLAAQGLAPKLFACIDRAKRPLGGIALSATFDLLSFIVASPKENEVFKWLVALSRLSSIFTWGSIYLCHVRFRRAIKLQNRSLDEVA